MKKWQGAYFMPEQVKMNRELWRDTQRVAKPLIDEHEIEEFDQRIHFGMEYNLAVTFLIWNDGFTEDMTGGIHSVDQITHQLRLELKPGEFNRGHLRM